MTITPTSPLATTPSSLLPLTTGSMSELQRCPLRLMQQMHRKHGDIFAYDDHHKRVVFVASPQFNREVMGQPEIFQASFFPIRGPKHSAQRRLSSGLINMNGDQHKRHRRMIMEVFQKRAFALYEQPVLRILDEMLSTWKPGITQDLHGEMTRLMLDVTSRILFGIDQRGLTQRAGEMIDHWVAMNHRQTISVLDSNHAGGETYQELLDYAESLEEVIRSIIKLRRQQSGRDDLLSLLLEAFEGPQRELTEDEFIGHSSLLFAAAHLTTAHSLTWAFFLLTQHPVVQARLREELTSHLDGRPLPFSETESLPYLNRVVTESMRILPASCYVHRVVSRPVQLGPFSLQPGAAVAYSQFLTHHSSALYEHPERFDPDRWLTQKPAPYAYIPFGTGPRMCIGGPLALVIIKTVLSVVVQRFQLSLSPAATVDYVAESTMLGPAHDVPVQLHSPQRSAPYHRAAGTINELVRLPQRL